MLIAFIPAGASSARSRHDFIKRVLFDPPMVIAIALIVGGIAILIFERIAPTPRYREGDHLPLLTCLWIGVCQCLALIPGVSRSGATIMGGLMLGVERKAAAEFTFYLAVPTMFGAFVFDLYKNWSHLLSGRRHADRRRLRGVVPRRLRGGEDVHRLHLALRAYALRLVPHRGRAW